MYGGWNGEENNIKQKNMKPMKSSLHIIRYNFIGFKVKRETFLRNKTK